MSPDSGGPTLPVCPHCGSEHPEDKLKCPNTDMVLPLAGRILHGKFRFEQLIGRGGMAEVWLARNELVDREVALKLIRPEVARHEENVARFRSEAKAAGRIGSSQICDILDFGHSPIGPYIVMERLRGVSLGEVLRAKKILEPQMAVMVLRQALVGLDAAHRSGIIHRDLKPENIFLHRPEGGDPIVKLMDFGVSKFTDGTAELETEHGVLLGTPEYMAPEQCKGARHADARTDMWAIGAILYRALAGHDAFHGESLAATLMIVATEDATSLSEIDPQLDPKLVAVVEKCLARAPEDRYQNASELSEALAPFDTGDQFAVWKDLGGVSDTLVGLASAPTQIKTPQPSNVTTAPRPVVPRATPEAPELPDEHESAGPPRWAALAGLALLIAGGAFALSRIGGDEGTNESVAKTEEKTDETGAAPTDPPEPAPEPTPEPAPGPTPEPAPEPTPEPTPEPDTPNQPPPTPDPDQLAETTTGEAEAPKPPEGVVLTENWVTPIASGKNINQRGARKACEKLAAEQHLGIKGWKLANPSIAMKFAGNEQLRKSWYWTSAAHKGKAVMVGLPAGKKYSQKVQKPNGRALCVASWP